MLSRMFERLLHRFGPQGWWPVRHGLIPQEWEIMAGAILTQNTTWSNADRALARLARAGIMTREDVLRISDKELAGLIRPSGYHRQKARKLRALAGFEGELTRENLLSIWGIGPETADSILLYARDEPYFVIDRYTRRMFSRLGLIPEDAGYEELRSYFESRLPRDPWIYKEFHALIVEMGKRHCRPRPSCQSCALGKFCLYSRRFSSSEEEPLDRESAS